MKCRTHIVISNSLSLLMLRPTSIKETITCIAFASIGGVISDLDNKNDDNYHKINIILIVVSMLLLFSFIFDKRYNLMIYNDSIVMNIIGLILIDLLCYFGSNKPHHSFLHSILGISLITLIFYVFIGNNYLPIMIGMISHIILDIFNYLPVLIMYPYNRGICLKKYSYKGKEDKIIFIIGVIAIILEIFLI